MSLVIDPMYLPATLTAPPMTDEEFARFCEEIPDYFVEVTAAGEILILPPNFSLTSARNLAISSPLFDWAVRDDRGIATDPSGGFVLPNGARRAPDAAWSFQSRVKGLSAKEQEKFWHFCPDFVIELKSQSDRLPVLRAKCGSGSRTEPNSDG